MPFDISQDSHVALKKVISERTSPVIGWVGAGLSAPAGLPSWERLLDDLIAVVRRKLATITITPKTKGLEALLYEERRKKNYWLCFQLIEDLLGGTSYQSEIRERLDTASHANIPTAYGALWKAGLQGLVTFNLDQFATRSFSIASPGASVDLFVGSQARNMLGVLQRSRPFIGNVHGVVDDASSWIFTHDKLQALLKDNGYRQFVNACLLTRTILFVGVSADDVALQTHLDIVRMAGITGISHFWITSRIDEETDAWSEQYRIRVIRYKNDSGKHEELLECLADLGQARPSTDVVDSRPVVPTHVSLSAAAAQLEDPDTLIGRPLEYIRQQLNAHAQRLLETPNAAAYLAYDTFSRQYDEAIDRAWYVTENAPKNVLLGYTITRRVSTGSFGEVFEALDDGGNRVAVKLLRRDVRREPAMLQTFRRGVRSMRILKTRHVGGMIDFIDASEIPAIVVMDWVDGPNLADAVQKKVFKNWTMILTLARDLARIIHAAHLLPERVLHRDIRPPNVMLRDFWTNGNELNVVVMDFDLSWHVDALEKSIVAKPLGFMAPEQLHQRESASTRSALVDSFGFGMTLYFVLTGEIPVPDQQRHHDWDKTLKNKIQSRRHSTWKSLPARVSRLVDGATKDVQKERWDFSRIVAEIEVLYKLDSGEIDEVSADYYCDEIASHSECMEGYSWNEGSSAAAYRSLGLKIDLAADLPQDEVKLTLEWSQTGTENWTLLPKSGQQVLERTRPILERAGWRNTKFEGSLGYMRITAIYTTDASGFNAGRLAKGIDSLVASMLPKS